MPEKVGNVLSWATDLGGEAQAQAQRAAAMPFVEGHLALMPDAHFGMGATIGSVIPTLGAIIPAAVGVDIGCGMIAVMTNATENDLPENLDPILDDFGKHIPAGVGRGHQRGYKALPGDTWFAMNPNARVEERNLGKKTVEQFGTLGSGNHFVEVCLDEHGQVWLVLHSGSRGVGNQLAQFHIKRAKGLMKERFVSLEDKDLAYFVEADPEFKEYILDLRWGQDYALGSREAMMDQAVLALKIVLGNFPLEEENRINCHHNYTEQENHGGKNLWITRKGAIRARAGDLGVIPGSMGAASYIVRGLGNPASYNSAAHGAGRQMSRTKAKQEFTVEDLAAKMAGKTWNYENRGRLLDEHPGAYKDIDVVMANQADLVEVVYSLHQIVNYKGA